MSKKLFIIFLLAPCLCNALPRGHKKPKANADTVINEAITRQQVIATADSIMAVYMGDLFSSCTYNKKGYYSYIDSANGKLHWSMLSKHKKLKGILKNVFMSYVFDHSYPKCSAYDRIKGTIYLKLDSALASTGKPDTRFIPDFVWQGTDCRLITADKVIALAYDFGFKEGTKPKAAIQYDIPVKQFYWNISNRIPQDSTIQKRFVTQTMQINAYTRKKINYTKTDKQQRIQH